MAIGPGAILFTANFTAVEFDGTHSESFSFIATEDIAAGEIITFHAPEAGYTTAFQYTVGPDGLSALDRVTIHEINDTFTVTSDPSGGSAGNYFQTDPVSVKSWSITPSDNIIASSEGEAIAAISNTGDWDQNLGETGLDTTAIENAILFDVPSPVTDNITTNTLADSNVMFAGDDYADIDDPLLWVTTDAAQDFDSPNIAGTTYATQDADIMCFAKGTMILTPTGEVPVETLAIGDLVTTAEGQTAKVLWLGHQTRLSGFGMSERIEPVRISAGALGNGLPHSDLTVTADHGMILDGMVINASAMVNGTTIDFVPASELPARVTYFHIETQAHNVILANGAASETFIDYLGRRAFDNYAEYEALYGSERIIPEMPHPRVSAQRLMPDAIRARLGIDSDAFEFELGLDLALCA